MRKQHMLGVMATVFLICSVAILICSFIVLLYSYYIVFDKKRPRILTTPPVAGENWIVGDMVMLWVPEGEFIMGNPADEEGREPNGSPSHRVTISSGFWMGEKEVTQRFWDYVMGYNWSCFKDDDRPVERVSWKECMDFCARLTALCYDSISGGFFTLPSEAEWEYACRAGTNTPYFFGTDPSLLREYCVYAANSTEIVGSRRPNPWGFYDMYGNVTEYCLDRFSSDTEMMNFKVTRGGYFHMFKPELFHSSARDIEKAESGYAPNGFRVVFKLASTPVPMTLTINNPD